MLNKFLTIAVLVSTSLTARAAETSVLANYGTDLCGAAVQNGAAGDDNDDDIGQGCLALVAELTATPITAAALTQKICLRAADWSSTYFEATDSASAAKLKKLNNKAIKECFDSSVQVAQTSGVEL